MKDRIDPLIEDRAPWLFADRPGTALARKVLDRALSYQRTVDIATALRDAPSATIMDEMFHLLGRNVTARGLHNIPSTGPALVVANHPTGIADGIILHGLLARTRPDAFYFANKDILSVMPQMEDMIAPVEWRKDRRSHGKTRETMAYMRRALRDERLGVIFPSGRLAQRRGLQLHERPWMPSAAMLARKFDLPVIPVNIRARNSVLFYLFDILHASLKDITLFHETLNKANQPFVVTVGEAIAPSALPETSEEGIEMLRRATLALGEEGSQTVSLIKATRRPLLRF
ncbi:1-acyl-sn-glycerol-3-phosphate acyltransferase [Salibaculum griseiflavum]|uniref:Glycerol acyltransferase n=1 Tax=Salibaculum griseiflavum TaxID=1914409 RepID=A0A2V1P667_9RHOB|nr:1-acyl-sn-glycerol-3-phosphate acyltransferase [Salibaculum griseiflavum]PWG17314.1 glycerol acyltransferase [Salibaculum griseiflavum]